MYNDWKAISNSLLWYVLRVLDNMLLYLNLKRKRYSVLSQHAFEKCLCSYDLFHTPKKLPVYWKYKVFWAKNELNAEWGCKQLA